MLAARARRGCGRSHLGIRRLTPPSGHGAQNRGERLVVVASAPHPMRAMVEAAVSRAFLQSRVRWAAGPGQALQLARAAVAEADIVASVGDDPHAAEVLNGVFLGMQEVNRRVIFTAGPLAAPTDLTRCLGMPGRLAGALWGMSTGITLPLDLGHVKWADGGERVFLGAIRATGGGLAEGAVAFVANGFFWDGRRVCGGGSMSDGAFEVVVVPETSLSRRHLAVLRAFGSDLASLRRATRFQASKLDTASVEFEPGAREGAAAVTLLSRALHVRGGWIRPP